VLGFVDEQRTFVAVEMTDTRTAEQRRRIMQSVGTKDTGPELVVRRALFALGYRYRLHRKDLAGRPDIVLPSRRKAIFVHGCFWHGHGCPKGRASKSRVEYWGPKLEANRARDARNLADLKAQGWDVSIVWQCELGDPAKLSARLKRFVERPTKAIDKTRTKR
jgi:DNA mismatch endonuclease, patch repair protein